MNPILWPVAAATGAGLYALLRHFRVARRMKNLAKQAWEALKKLLEQLFGNAPKPANPEDIQQNPAAIPAPELRKIQASDIQALAQMLAGGGAGHGKGQPTELEVQKILRLVKQLESADLPIFRIAKKRIDDAHKQVPVQKFKRKVRKVPKVVEGTVTDRTITTVQTPAVDMQEEYDLVPARSMSQLKRMTQRVQLGLPRSYLVRRMLDGQIRVREYQETHQVVKEKTRKTKETITVDEPYMEAYTEMQEVVEAPESQVLYILIDGSGSMDGWKSIVAAAIAISVIRRGLDNRSKYHFRSFSSYVFPEYTGETKTQKLALIQRIVKESYNGGGTNIMGALEVAIQDIKSETKADRAEILLITDGNDLVDGQWLRYQLDDEILLHTVMLGDGNASLHENSSTYVPLADDFGTLGRLPALTDEQKKLMFPDEGQAA